VSDSKYRSWAEELHGLWKSLGRKVNIGFQQCTIQLKKKSVKTLKGQVQYFTIKALF